MNDFIEICTTTNSMKIAKSISQALLKAKISPCIQILPNIVSSYVWNDENVNDNEILVKIKTLRTYKKKVVNEICKIHNYDTPEIISYKINIELDKYKKWLNKYME